MLCAAGAEIFRCAAAQTPSNIPVRGEHKSDGLLRAHAHRSRRLLVAAIGSSSLARVVVRASRALEIFTRNYVIRKAYVLVYLRVYLFVLWKPPPEAAKRKIAQFLVLRNRLAGSPVS